MGAVVVGVRQPERRHHHGRVDVADGCLELVDDRRRPDPVVPVQVLVLDEVEPDGLRAELVQRVDIFASTGNEGIVTGREAGQLVPPRHRLGVGVGRAGEDRQHGRARVRGEEMPATEHRVVEVGREHEDSGQLLGGDASPLAQLAGHNADYLRMLTARAMTSATVISDTADCASMVSFAHRERGITSVGLNAVAFVNEKYK